jgi:cytochrome b pre-mRNA-processing protein 3
MLAWLKKIRARRQTARFLYGSIVTAARRRDFYADWGAPDTLQGRFEMILVHLVLAQRRLILEGDTGARLARALNEAFVVDMDDQMREMTFGDLRVPREIAGAATALFDRWRAYDAALAGRGERPLAEVLAAEFAYLDPEARIDTRSLAEYMRRAADALLAEPSARVLAGEFAWPSPRAPAVSEEPLS